MGTFLSNTKTETPPKNDLDAFQPGPPQHRIDDKAAVLEKEVQSLKSGFNRERFLYFFVIQCLMLSLAGLALPGKVFYFLIVAALLFSIGLAKHLDFPWIGMHLEKWHDLFYKAAEKWMLGKKPKEIETEPFENGNE